MTITSVDFLLVGQGLAGSLLAIELLQRGKSLRVIDNCHSACASQVAAGVINPVTGHRLNISDGFDIYAAVTANYYPALERLLGASFYSTIAQLRLLKNPGQYDYYRKRAADPRYISVLGDYAPTSDYFQHTPYGAVGICQSAIVRTSALLEATRSWLISQQSYQSALFDYTALEIGETVTRYSNLEAKTVIFCEGYQAINNPWLHKLPFKLSKGEIIDLEVEPELNQMLNWGNWLVPGATSSSARLGASYEWHDLSLNSSPAWRKKLLDSLAATTQIRARAGPSKVGIRPTTVQRKPFVGAISSLPNHYCFNGFGSKGCLLIPYYAQRLVEHLLESRPLPDEVSQWL